MAPAAALPYGLSSQQNRLTAGPQARGNTGVPRKKKCRISTLRPLHQANDSDVVSPASVLCILCSIFQHLHLGFQSAESPIVLRHSILYMAQPHLSSGQVENGPFPDPGR